MPLPPDFDDWKHLKSQLRQVHNPRVKKWFKDAPDFDIVTGPASLKQACTIGIDDTASVALLRMWLFEIELGHASRVAPAYYGYPINTFQEHREVTYHPQVKLFFSQDSAAAPQGYNPLEAEISFRLMDETSKTINETKATTLALKVKAAMGSSEAPFNWNKGKIIFTYEDLENGYDLRIYAQSETQALTICQKIVNIRDHTFNDDFFKEHKPKKSSINVPSSEIIYGESRRKRRWRPTAVVKFRWASLAVWGLDRDILLYDPFNRMNDQPLIR